MAGNKINTKTKGKDDKGKVNKQSNADTEEPDFTLLRRPILTSITGFGQAKKIFDMATEELKTMLSNECDILYECKVCRNIFRSLVNFISHKRVYCKEKFNSTVHGHFLKATSTISELTKINQVEEGYQESLKEKENANSIESIEVDKRIPLTKDLTAIVEKIAKIKGIDEHYTEVPQIDLQKIPNSSVAVFQNFNQISETNSSGTMKVQVNELENLLSRNIAVLQSDGNFKIQRSISSEIGNVIQISDDEDNEDSDVLKCQTCDIQFSTQKTHKYHMNSKHVENRLVYPCSDCLEIFSTSWSVYRHLFKVHRKSAAQIRRLRESIQSKAFEKNNPPAFYEKRKNNMKSTAQKMSEEERIDQENQAWMENMEELGSVPRCGGCGRAFERRAALAAHAHTCQPRSRALSQPPHAPRRPDAKRIEIQIRKDYNKGPPATMPAPTPTPTHVSPPSANINDLNKPHSITEANVNKGAKGDASSKSPEDRDDKFQNESGDMVAIDVAQDCIQLTDVVDAAERKTETKSCFDAYELVVSLPHDRRAEKSNILALKQKMNPDIEIIKLLCKKCDTRYDNTRELYDHMANHYGWMRYACKLCTFKNYYFEKLPEHVNVVHKLKGNKEFYFSTVKAIDGIEALKLLKSTDEPNDTNDASPESSSTCIEIGAKKRKMNYSKIQSKKRKESIVKVGEDRKEEVGQDKVYCLGNNESSTNIKDHEENSYDMDEVDQRIAKRQMIENSLPVASTRPVRRRTKPKNDDFEYDLSNLLKMEAQGYRDSQSVTNSKSNLTKKKVNPETQLNYDSINKDCYGALVTLSKNAVEVSAAHMKTSNFAIYSVQKEPRSSNVFVKPMLPKSFSRGEKISPKKDSIKDKKDITSPNKEAINQAYVEVNRTDREIDGKKEMNDTSISNKDQNDLNNSPQPSVSPIQFRSQSLDSLINRNVTDFTKARIKNKILVIKSVNKNKDETSTSTNTPLKLQTIKLKYPNSNSFMKHDKSAEQVVVVKVPKVDCSIPRSETGPINVEQSVISPINDNMTKIQESKKSENVSCGHVYDDGLLVLKCSETLEVNPENSKKTNDTNDKSTKFPTNQPENIETSLSI